MHAIVVAGGELPPEGVAALAGLLSSGDLVIAADAGLHHCRTLGAWPDVLVGDMDSAAADLVEQAAASGVHVLRHTADKDATDLELALEVAMERGASRLTVVAIFGGRLDHELATIAMLASSRFGEVPLMACDGRRSLWVVRSSVELALSAGTSISLIPWGGDTSGVTTTGLAWRLDAEPLPLGSTRGVSNRCVAAHQRIEVCNGTLLVAVDHDQS